MTPSGRPAEGSPPPIGEREHRPAAPLGGDSPEERGLLSQLRAGDEDAFELLIDRHHRWMLHVASIYVKERATAEEVVREAWIGLLESLDRFEARASLKTSIFHILVNTAKKRALRERRSIPFSTASDDAADAEPAVEPRRFLPSDHPDWPHHWAWAPRAWHGIPEDRLLARETRDVLRDAMNTLPRRQQQVITLRDVEGWNAAEVCNALTISETNQRVLLHRARARVREALERYLTDD